MCGIAGFTWNDEQLLGRMMDSIHHRGPDESGRYISDQVSLGHQRLKIIDLSTGRQPIGNEDGSIQVIFNGEIYNFRDLRGALEQQGHTFSTNTDTEVIVHSYEEWGVQCLKKFNGMFAFALYDEEKKILFLARDRFGVKPLYFYFDNGKLIFSSEIKAILEYNGISPSVNRDALMQYFRFRYVPGESTLFHGIKKLKPGNFIIFQDSTLRIDSYFDLQEAITADPENILIPRLLKELRSAVHSRLVSEVPLGVYLSGGIDSAAIVAMMSEKTDNIKTFTVDFAGVPGSERTYAKKIADQFSTEHHEFSFTDNDLSCIPKMVWHLDEPIGDAATLPTMVLSREAKKWVTVVLAGEGGDETFAGYDNQRIMARCMAFDRFPRLMKRIITFFGRFTPAESNAQRIIDVVSTPGLPAQYTSLVSLFSTRELQKIGFQGEPEDLNKNDQTSSQNHISDYRLSDQSGTPVKQYSNTVCPQLFPLAMKPLNQLLYFGFKTWLPNDFCMKADKMTMAYGIEERTPFLDYKLVNFAFTLPVDYKIRHGVGKYLLKKSLEPQLSQEIIYRKKHGYNAPMDYWFKGPLKCSLENLLEDRSHTLYHKDYPLYLLEKFQRTGDNYSLNFFNAQKLWSVLMFELWYRIFIEHTDYRKIHL